MTVWLGVVLWLLSLLIVILEPRTAQTRDQREEERFPTAVKGAIVLYSSKGGRQLSSTDQRTRQLSSILSIRLLPRLLRHPCVCRSSLRLADAKRADERLDKHLQLRAENEYRREAHYILTKGFLYESASARPHPRSPFRLQRRMINDASPVPSRQCVLLSALLAPSLLAACCFPGDRLVAAQTRQMALSKNNFEPGYLREYWRGEAHARDGHGVGKESGNRALFCFH